MLAWWLWQQESVPVTFTRVGYQTLFLSVLLVLMRQPLGAQGRKEQEGKVEL